uniref:Mobile element protein n=1 Tax=uncultured bacterium esnapd26 TaxID=1366607 RepID=S5UBY8_9BACT|nr:mobile element protein [uncultured bacterium esnapd26]
MEVARRFRVTQMSTNLLEAELRRGPAAHGWVEDQRWTLARVADLIARLHHVRSTPRGVSYLLHRSAGHRRCPCTGQPSGTRR